MRRFRNLLVIALAAAGTACLYEREVIRDGAVLCRACAGTPYYTPRSVR